MRRQRVSTSFLATLLLIGGVGIPAVAVLRPCESQFSVVSQARAQEPTPQPEPAPTPKPLRPSMRFEPADAPQGTVVRLFVNAPDSARVVINWEPFTFGYVKINEGEYWVVPKDGDNPAKAEFLWTTESPPGIQREVVEAHHHCGPAKPAPTLAELAAPHTKALGAVYALLAKRTYESLEQFHGIEAVGLREAGLADNPAVAAIAERLDKSKDIAAVLLAVVKELGAEPGPVVTPVDPTVKATAATYVYEKDDTAIPSGVSTGLNRLNREKRIIATIFEDDTRDADGDVPSQYKVALDAAVNAGLPAFIVQAGDKVLSVVKSPTTEEQVWGAVP